MRIRKQVNMLICNIIIIINDKKNKILRSGMKKYSLTAENNLMNQIKILRVKLRMKCDTM